MKGIFLIAVLATGLAACGAKDGPFRLVERKGDIYRINQATGMVSLMDAGRFTPLGESPLTRVTAAEQLDTLAEAKVWPDLTGPENVKLTLKTSWRAGRMYVMFAVSPLTQKMADAVKEKSPDKGFNAILKDKNGFFLAVVPVVLSKALPLQDASGKLAGAMMNSNFETTKASYKAMDSWSANWNL